VPARFSGMFEIAIFWFSGGVGSVPGQL